MSLDVYLYVEGDDESVYDSNITHNLSKMAQECGVYMACWCPEAYNGDWQPERINSVKAKHILPMLKEGILLLKANPEHYRKFDAPNGWGIYEDFLPWLEKYAEACEKYPDAIIKVSR